MVKINALHFPHGADQHQRRREVKAETLISLILPPEWQTYFTIIISNIKVTNCNQEIHKATSAVTSLGKELCLKASGISLQIPQGAISEQKVVYVTLSLPDDDHLPPLDDGHSLICPVVKCEPEGIHFLEDAILTLPSYAVEDDERNVTIWTSQSSYKSSQRRKRTNGEHFWLYKFVIMLLMGCFTIRVHHLSHFWWKMKCFVIPQHAFFCIMNKPYIDYIKLLTYRHNLSWIQLK